MPDTAVATGGRGFVCPMCSLNVKHHDPVKLHGLWEMHVRTHRDAILKGIEAMLRYTP